MEAWSKTNHLLAAVVVASRKVVDEAQPISRQHDREPDEFVIPAYLYHGLKDAVDQLCSWADPAGRPGAGHWEGGE